MNYLKFFCFLLICSSMLPTYAQKTLYSVANAHSHNDYLQQNPFFGAYNEQFGSIEADIFLVGKLLLVAHDSTQLTEARSLEKLYLVPLASGIERNNGFVFKDRSRKLQLLIDLKTKGAGTMNALVELLKKYPSIIHNPSVSIVITGNRPAAKLYPN
ncbi:MAG: alkaline phosphatase, partial [Ferruginibacter sp.]